MFKKLTLFLGLAADGWNLNGKTGLILQYAIICFKLFGFRICGSLRGKFLLARFCKMEFSYQN